MEILEIRLGEFDEAQDVAALIQGACEALQLEPTLIGTLTTYPGCTHWHYKTGKEKGVLEATYWPRENRAWLSYRTGRDAASIVPAIQQIKKSVEGQLGGTE